MQQNRDQAGMPEKFSREQAEGDRAQIERELARSGPPREKPGDEAPPGTPGTGDKPCGRCGGSGRVDGATCPECNGSGTITGAIGGA